MRFLSSVVLGGALSIMLLLLGALAYVRSTGLDARPQPRAVERRLALAARRLAVPPAVRMMTNPVSASADAVAEGMAHYADHCAACHANDGSGATEMGRGFFPKVPDMRLGTTQTLSDGELFYVIEHGVRFTGMPAWSTGTRAGEESTWRLVRFLRHLPQLTPAELEAMKARNPRSPEEVRQELEEARFLNEGAAR